MPQLLPSFVVRGEEELGDLFVGASFEIFRDVTKMFAQTRQRIITFLHVQIATIWKQLFGGDPPFEAFLKAGRQRLLEQHIVPPSVALEGTFLDLLQGIPTMTKFLEPSEPVDHLSWSNQDMLSLADYQKKVVHTLDESLIGSIF